MSQQLVNSSLLIFWCPSGIPGHLTHTSQPKKCLYATRHRPFRSDFIQRFFHILTVRKILSAVIVFFIFKFTSCVSNGIMVTSFKRSLKYSLHLRKMFSSLLKKKHFGLLMDIAISHIRFVAAKPWDSLIEYFSALP